MDKEGRLAWLAQAWSQCRGCTLCYERKTVVFGYGNKDAQVLVVGEAPGTNEDKEGVPFVGRAGHLLDQYLAATSVQPEIIEMQNSGEIDVRRVRELLLQDFFLTNVVACHPPENRDPSITEIGSCRARLDEIIYVVDPVLILAAGRIAVETLTGRKVNITSVRGELFDVQVPGRYGPLTYPMLAMLHTSYLLRQNDFNTKGGYGSKTYDDVLEAMRIIDLFNQMHYGIPRPAARPKPEERR